MEELIDKLGIDWKLLIAQIINFLVLLFVLYKFAYKPILKMLHDRQHKIKKSLSDAKKIEEKMKQADKMKEERILEAKKEAQVILEKTDKEAEQAKHEKLIETKNEMEKLATRTKEELASEKKKMVEKAKAEIGDLVISTSEKVIKQKLDDKTDKKLIEETIKQVK